MINIEDLHNTILNAWDRETGEEGYWCRKIYPDTEGYADSLMLPYTPRMLIRMEMFATRRIRKIGRWFA